MTAQYLIRFDDICPTMDWQVWDRIEDVLVENGVAPILAVVPDNRDPALVRSAERADFWRKVREWQARGWAIGLHGFQHRYVTREPGILGLNSRSEFAGLTLEEQREKIRQALAIFARNEVRADAWVAPAHSFDANTVLALRESGLRVISDGFFRNALRHEGMIWVPQQLWRFRDFQRGVWTVCYHHNTFSARHFERFAHDLKAYRTRMASLQEVLDSARPMRRSDSIFARLWLHGIRGKRALSRLIGRTAN